jgi:hypothetical protein
VTSPFRQRLPGRTGFPLLTDSLMTLQVLSCSVSFDVGLSLFGFLVFSLNSNSARHSCHCRLSFTASHVPTTILVHSGLTSNAHNFGISCVLTVINGGVSVPMFASLRVSLIVRVFSSTLLPGFIGPESLVLPVNLPPSVPHRFGFASSVRFYSVDDSS